VPIKGLLCSLFKRLVRFLLRGTSLFFLEGLVCSYYFLVFDHISTNFAQMPLSSEYGSSAVSESWKDNVISRDGGLCVLCGIYPVDVAPIVAHIVYGDSSQVS
jgi:hypothetical protein